MTDELIQRLGQVIAEDLRNAPAAASVEQLVERLQQDERIEQMIQLNTNDSVGFQTLVEDGGIANIGVHLHDFDEEKLQKVLKAFWKSLQPKDSPNNLPRSGVVKFVGRVTELETLHAQLQEGELVAISAIAGMGGVGKTELAIQYAKAFRYVYPAGVCWLLAREMDVGIQIIGYARTQLGLRVPDDMELLDQVRFCWRNWPEGNALIVLDDITSYSEVEPYLPPENSHFKVLVTTRLKLGPPVRTLSLDVLDLEKSLELLESFIGEERVAAELEVASSLCEWLGYLPLGLELVGRYLARKPDLSLEELRDRLEERELQARALKQTEAGMTANLGVASAFELSWQELSEAAQELACLLSCFALAPIPWERVEACMPEADPEELEDWRDEELVRLSFLKRVERGRYQYHQLIQRFIRTKLTEFVQPKSKFKKLIYSLFQIEISETNQLITKYCQAMVSAAQEINNLPTKANIIAWARIEPHVIEVATQWLIYVDDEELIWPFIGLGRFYSGQGNYNQAARWGERCLVTTQDRLGKEHLFAAVSLNNLGSFYCNQGKYSEAELLYQQAIAIRKQILGEEHLDVASSLSSLASLYSDQGRYSEAELLYQQAIAIRRQLLGEQHLDVASSLHGLASLYQNQGRHAEAELLLKQVLKIQQNLLGGQHIDVANSLNSLAVLYQSQSRYDEAELLHQKALNIRRQLLGEQHLHVASSLQNLASLYCDQGKYSKAELLYQKVLKLRQKLLGEQHPDVANSLNGLAVLYLLQSRYDEAEPLLIRALNLRQKLLGKQHLDIAISLNNLAGLYYHQRRYDEAEPLLIRALNLRQKFLGEQHPDVANSLNSLAVLYQSQNKYDEAEPLLKQALKLRRQLLREQHPDIANSLNNLAGIYFCQGRYGQAEPLYAKAFKILFEQLGKNHPYTQQGSKNLTNCLQQAIKAGQANTLSNHPLTQQLLAQLQSQPPKS